MIPTTMLAASYQGGNDDLALNKHYPVPKPKKGEVLIKILASGGWSSPCILQLIKADKIAQRSMPHGRHLALRRESGQPYLCYGPRIQWRSSRVSPISLHLPRGLTRITLRLGEGVDPHKARIGQLYAVNLASPCLRGINGAPAFLNTQGIGKDGAYAEYIAVSQDLLIPVVSTC